MHARELLLEQTRHHYAWLTRATADVDAAAAAWRPGDGRPSIAWEVAHLIEQVESTAEAVAGRSPSGEGVPEAWDALRARWREVARDALAALERLGPGDLERPPAVPLHPGFEQALATRARWWSGHVFHVAYHLGQVGSLRAALGLGWNSIETDSRQDPPTGS